MDHQQSANVDATSVLSQIRQQRQLHALRLRLRRDANIQGGALMIYRLILTVVVLTVMIAAAVAQLLAYAMAGTLSGPSDVWSLVEQTLGFLMESVGWGYLAAVVISTGILLLWKKGGFFREQIFCTGKPMTVGTFLALVCILFGVQLPAQLWSMALEWVCNQFDLSLLQILDENAMDMDNLGIWLYVCLAAPIVEELLFRGLVLRSLQNYGKRFAIVTSAVLFGIFHASPVQTPYAVLAGLVLGYVAVEHHVLWAMVLHMMNNWLLSDSLPRLLERLPYQLGDSVLWVFLGICTLIGLLLLLRNHGRIAMWYRADPIDRWKHKAFYTAPCILLLSAWCMIDLLTYFILMFL